MNVALVSDRELRAAVSGRDVGEQFDNVADAMTFAENEMGVPGYVVANRKPVARFLGMNSGLRRPWAPLKEAPVPAALREALRENEEEKRRATRVLSLQAVVDFVRGSKDTLGERQVADHFPLHTSADEVKKLLKQALDLGLIRGEYVSGLGGYLYGPGQSSQRARRPRHGNTLGAGLPRVLSDGSRADPAMDRETITDELYEWTEAPLLTQKPGYLKPIAKDAGVSLSELGQLFSRLKRLDKTGHAGGVAADRIHHEMARLIDQLKEQVYNASLGQLDTYMRARNAWIES